MTDRFEIAKRLREIASWLRFRGDKGFRARAYDTGASAIEAVADLEELASTHQLTSIPGVGPALARQIDELLATGQSTYLEELRGETPATLPALAELASLSPAKMLKLHEELGISDEAGLVAALKAGQLTKLSGFGPKSEARITAALARPRDTGARLTLEGAYELADEVVAFAKRDPHFVDIAIAGELRRAIETVSCVDLVVKTANAEQTLAHLRGFERIAKVDEDGERGFFAQIAGGPRLRITAASPTEFVRAFFETTGPAEHVARVDELLLDESTSGRAFVDEAELYRSAGLSFIPPEQRDRADVIETVLDGEDLDDLLEASDLRGMVHCHTTYSDGRNSVEEMARAAETLGYAYITITDHSPTAHYANGVEIERLKRQWDEIDEAQSKLTIRILRGTESDITKDGALDYPDHVLERFDVIVASIHNRYHLDADAMTDRVERAMRLPVFKIWGHAFGRILLQREPYACDIDRILDAIAASNAAIEVNGDPNRLDLPPAFIPRARERGIRFVLSSDAHSVNGLQAIRYAVSMARRGGLRKADVLNTRPVEAFLDAVRPLRVS